jgi:hypothetical protein
MKQEPARNYQETVSVSIALGDLAVIGHVLFPYARFVRFVLPPSPERGRTLTMVEHLRRRIADVSRGGKEGELFPLTVAELSIIDAALRNFVANLRQIFPPSQERDGTISACEGLRGYLAASFSPREDSEGK